MRISPGIVLRPTPPPLFRTQGHSPPPSDLRGGRGAKDGNPTLQESGFPASLRSGVPARTAGLRGEIKEEAFAEGGCRGTFAPKACRPRRDVGSQACRKAGFLESRISVFRPSTAAQVGRWG